MSSTSESVVTRDPHHRSASVVASGRLRDLNTAGVLDAADVHVATRLGRLGGETDEDVLLAVALAVRAVRSGSVAVDLTTVARDVTGAVAVDPGAGVTDEPAGSWPEVERWVGAVSASPLRDRALHLEGSTVYLSRYWSEETQVVTELQWRAAAPPPVVDPTALHAALDAYFPALAAEGAGGAGAAGDYSDQRAAAETACTQWTSVITGGPGTGKTTTVARLLGTLLTLADGPLRIALAAPTGKAAARMAEAVRGAVEQPGFPADGEAEQRAATIGSLEATTLHRLLGSRPDNRTRFRHDRGNRLPHDVIVVDETSMVSLTLMARLLEAVRPSARLVLVGDADQLASVEAGAVLKDIVDGSAGPSPHAAAVTRLARTRRYGAGIGALAEAVRVGAVDRALAVLEGQGDVRWVELDEVHDLLRARVRALARAAEAGDAEAALAELERHRLLCAHRDGPAGVSHWNRLVERLLMAESGRDWLPEWYPGRPFIVNANDYGLRLFNGDTGVAVSRAQSTVEGQVVGVVASGAEIRHFPTTRLAEVSTAHAMTVHRSQGSQFDEVTVVLPDPESRVLTRELLYTAVTRARSTVRMVGTEASFRAAVERRAQRATGLARRLAGPPGG